MCVSAFVSADSCVHLYFTSVLLIPVAPLYLRMFLFLELCQKVNSSIGWEKKNLKRFNRKNTHPLGNRHRFVTVTCSMLCIPLNNALLRHCVMLFWLLVQPVGCLLFTMTCIRTCLYLVKFTLFSFHCPESSLCLHRLYSKKTSKRPKRLLLNQPLSHSGV